MSPCDTSISGQILPAGRKTPCRSRIAADRLDDGFTQTSQIAVEPDIPATCPSCRGCFFTQVSEYLPDHHRVFNPGYDLNGAVDVNTIQEEQLLIIASLTPDPEKAMLEPAALQAFLKFLCDVGR